jgi:broad specificity phosphatase PhoE
MEPNGLDFSTLLPLPGVWDFYLIRHGESEGNKHGIIQGRMEFPLTSRGMQQSLALGQWIETPDVILSSPLSRALNTGQIIAKEKGMALKKVNVLEELTEVDTGPFTGKTPEDLKHTMPDLWKAFRLHSWQAVQGAETQAMLKKRAESCWIQMANIGFEESQRQSKGSIFKQIIDTFTRKTNDNSDSLKHIKVLVVTHSGLIQWMFRSTFQVPLVLGLPSIKASNCGVFLFRIKRELDPQGELGFSSEWRMLNYLPYN